MICRVHAVELLQGLCMEASLRHRDSSKQREMLYLVEGHSILERQKSLSEPDNAEVLMTLFKLIFNIL